MKMLVGLGNPGAKYQLTRHNIGFLLCDAVCQAFSGPPFNSQLKALVAKIRTSSGPVLLVKPQTFMNLSGEAVRPLADYYKIEASDILVAHDEVDLPFGQLKFQQNRGAGGHNGIKSTHQHLGTSDYGRLRLGVDRPIQPGPAVADYVLQDFNQFEQKYLPDFLELSIDGLEAWFGEGGLNAAANKMNGRSLELPERSSQ